MRWDLSSLLRLGGGAGNGLDTDLVRHVRSRVEETLGDEDKVSSMTEHLFIEGYPGDSNTRIGFRRVIAARSLYLPPKIDFKQGYEMIDRFIGDHPEITNKVGTHAHYALFLLLPATGQPDAAHAGMKEYCAVITARTNGYHINTAKGIANTRIEEAFGEYTASVGSGKTKPMFIERNRQYGIDIKELFKKTLGGKGGFSDEQLEKIRHS